MHLPHLKPQDNFGGLLSSDKLKAFASTNDLRIDTDNYDDDFEGELLTIKGPAHQRDEVQEQTLRPIHKTAVPSTNAKSHQRTKSLGKAIAQVPGSSVPRSPSKGHFGNKFELPPRPDVVFREQSVEDFSDLFVDNDEAFNYRVNRAVRRVSSLFQEVFFSRPFMTKPCKPGISRHRCTATLPSIGLDDPSPFHAGSRR